MPRIFFDHQKFSTQRYGGISRYFANIISDLAQEPGFEVLLGVLHSRNEYIRTRHATLDHPWIHRLMSSKYSQKTYRINQQYCRWLLKKNEFDLFHPTYYDPYYFKDLKKPLVITVHDMTHERLPEYFWAEDPLTHNKRLNIERADKIIAISETTRDDLVRFSNVDPSRIEVIYHGIDLDRPLEVSPVDHLPESYILYVGDRSGFKNFYLFGRAFSELARKYPDLRMVLSGGGDLAIGEREFLKNLGVLDRVLHLHVSDAQLNFLYQHAAAFVYPSLHEGFGLPILEAFRVGCPVVLSDTPCFREVAAQGAAFFAPHDADSLVYELEQLISGRSRRQELIDAANTRLKFFPSQRTTDKTIEVYKSLL